MRSECTRAASDVRLWSDTTNASFAHRWVDNRPFLLPDPTDHNASLSICVVTKTASTATKRLLLAQIASTGVVLEHDWRRCPHGHLAFPGLSPSPSESIMVVRHPLHRLASAYHEIVRARFWHRLLPLAPPNATFDRLVHALVRTRDLLVPNPHYRPLVATCGLMRGMTYTTLLRFEDPVGMANALRRHLAPSQPKLKLRPMNVSMTRARRLYSSVALARMTNRYYKQDLFAFGYRSWLPSDAQVRWQ